MKIFYYLNNKCVGWIEQDEICCVDFCEYCGDCLHCYSDDACYYNNGEHSQFTTRDIDLEEFELIKDKLCQ